MSVKKEIFKINHNKYRTIKEVERVNHLYFFTVGEETLFVAAPSWKDARNLLLKLPQNKGLRLPQLTGYRVAKSCCAEQGVIPLSVVYSQLAWWECRCGNKSFIALDNGRGCRCASCGRERRLDFRKR
jgi:hypothetical protein